MSENRPDKDRADGYDLAVEEARPKVKRPPLYRVVLINDDFTPMEFVVDILEIRFRNGTNSRNAGHVRGTYKRKGRLRCFQL